MTQQTIAGHDVTDRQLFALHGLFKGLVKNNKTVYGVNVKRQLDTLADKGIIARTGMVAYTIPFGSPGADIITATPDYAVSAHL